MLHFFNAGVLALACASTTFASYVLEDDYSGTSFFDGFDFVTTDPTQGFVDYLTHDLAKGTTSDDYLIKYNTTTGTNYIGVDYWSTLDPAGTGRASVRIESTKTYQYGLIIIDLAHMPSNQYGLWPAFWTASHVNYPGQGEIDILENIHTATISRQALHTFPGCNVTANQVVKQQTGNQISYDCDDTSLLSKYGKQYVNEGCVSEGTEADMYGDAFNKAGGGVYATEWTSDAISIWFFGAGSVPSDITNGAPVPSSKWGKPAFTTANSPCVIDNFFKDHNIILNTDFCGTWAGKDDVWQSTDAYSTKYPTCASYVAANPKVYKNSYWEINSIKVYQNSSLASTSSSSIISSTSSVPHSSSTKISSTKLSSTEVSTTSIRSSVPTVKSTSTAAISTSSTSHLAKSSASSASPLASSAKITPSAGSSSASIATHTSKSSSSLSEFPSSKHTSTSVGSSESPLKSSSAALTSAGSLSHTSQTITSSSIELPEFTPVTATPSPSLSKSHVQICSARSRKSTKTSSKTIAAFTTSTVYATSVYTVTSCAPTVTDCPAKLGSVTTETIALYTTVCPVSTTASSPSKSTPLTTSTIYATSVYTVTSCAASVTDCPAKLGSVTTEILTLRTTFGPVLVSETTKGVQTATTSLVEPTTTEYTTSIVFTTSVHSITACHPDATECSSKLGSVTTETIALYTTICPVSASASPTPSSSATTTTASGKEVPVASSAGGLSTIHHEETTTTTKYRTVSAQKSTRTTSLSTIAVPTFAPTIAVSSAPTTTVDSKTSVKTSTPETELPEFITTAASTVELKSSSTAAAASSTVSLAVFEGAATELRVGGLAGLVMVMVAGLAIWL